MLEMVVYLLGSQKKRMAYIHYALELIFGALAFGVGILSAGSARGTMYFVSFPAMFSRDTEVFRVLLTKNEGESTCIPVRIATLPAPGIRAHRVNPTLRTPAQ
jgi:hypothetical protein